MKKILITVLVLAISFIGIGLAYDFMQRQKFNSYLERHKPSANLKFKFEKYEGTECGIYDDYIKSAKWLSSKKLEVIVHICANGEDFYWLGDYKLVKDTIDLYYTSFHHDKDACGCEPIRLIYMIDEIDKQNLKYRIFRKEDVRF